MNFYEDLICACLRDEWLRFYLRNYAEKQDQELSLFRDRLLRTESHKELFQNNFKLCNLF